MRHEIKGQCGPLKRNCPKFGCVTRAGGRLLSFLQHVVPKSRAESDIKRCSAQSGRRFLYNPTWPPLWWSGAGQRGEGRGGGESESRPNHHDAQIWAIFWKIVGASLKIFTIFCPLMMKTGLFFSIVKYTINRLHSPKKWITMIHLLKCGGVCPETSLSRQQSRRGDSRRVTPSYWRSGKTKMATASRVCSRQMFAANVSAHMSGWGEGYAGTSEAGYQAGRSLSRQHDTCPGGTRPSVPDGSFASVVFRENGFKMKRTEKSLLFFLCLDQFEQKEKNAPVINSLSSVFLNTEFGARWWKLTFRTTAFRFFLCRVFTTENC